LKWKGLRVYAADGTDVRLPAEQSLRDKFTPDSGLAEGTSHCHYPSALMVEISDCKSGMPIAAELHKRATHEPRALLDLIPQLNTFEKGILILDRGYTGYEFISRLEREYNGFFLIRNAGSSTMQAVSQFLSSNAEDAIIELKKPANWRAGKGIPETVNYCEPSKVRAIRMELANGKVGVLLTNYLSNDASAADLRALYRERWKIETGFRTAKCEARMENFQSRSETSIRQECLALAVCRAIVPLLALLVHGRPAQVKNALRSFSLGAVALLNGCDEMAERCFDETMRRIRSVRISPAVNRITKSFPRFSRMPINKWTKMRGPQWRAIS